MRIRAGIILIQDEKVALIERHRAGLHYFVFPGGGVNEGESPKQAAIRESMEELGIEVVIKQRVAEIQVGYKSRQFYYLVEQIGGTFGTGAGEEYTEMDPDEGIYNPVWMSIDELAQHEDVHPSDVAKLVIRSRQEGWAQGTAFSVEDPK